MRSVEVGIFEKEVVCTYRGDEYHVRDNGAVLRASRIGQRRRPLDETWTFGRPSKSDGYMSISGHTVHRIVATAFYGSQPTKQHVVDHIDTNRRNNRPENLRWVTRLENILLNPITAKRVKYFYGSIEEFLADPGTPRNGTLTKDFEWMRTVTPEEANYSLTRLQNWAKADQSTRGGSLGDWIFGKRAEPKDDSTKKLVASNTPGAVQKNWKVPALFPSCPNPSQQNPLEVYYDRLKIGELFTKSPFGQTKVHKSAMSNDGVALFILGENAKGSIKPWSLAQVTFEDDVFVHESCGTFFTLEGAEKQFTLIQNLLWDGGDSIDDYC